MENQEEFIEWDYRDRYGVDLGSEEALAHRAINYPKIYGMKSPNRNCVFTDIDQKPSINQRWKRLELNLGDEMQIVEFYLGQRGNQAGATYSEILTWTNGQLEMDHDYVQWLFPSNERSMLNGEAPTLTKEESQIFEESSELQEKVKQAFVRMLGFLEFELSQDDETILIKPKSENMPWWIGRFNHNMLRVTRILKCLRLTGLTRYANAFYNALQAFKPHFSQNTWKFWTDAVFEPLW